MSGYVLTPGWRGDYLGFLLRRLLRLWPVYAFALAVAALIFGRTLTWGDFAFYPLLPSRDVWAIDSPVWSLRIEMWAMLAMPFIVWSGKTLRRAVIGVLVFAVAGYFESRLACGVFFVLGGYLARYRFDFDPLNWAIPQWLGKISYSLYLTHVVVFGACAALPYAAVIQIPLALLVGWLVWATIETRSIVWSRKAESILTRAKMAIA